MIKRETLILLRVPFSVFFLPVFLFAWSQSAEVHSWERLLFVFVLLHILVYPLISGIENQKAVKEVPKGFFTVLTCMALLALIAAFFVSQVFLLQLLFFIAISLAARRGAALFVWKMLLRGGLIYWIVQTGIAENGASLDSWSAQPWAKIAASCAMACLYVSGQIFIRSLASGSTSTSSSIQYTPSFPAITGLLLAMSLCFWMHLPEGDRLLLFLLLQFFLLPVYGFLVYWYRQVSISSRAASFDLSMRMSLLLVSTLSFYFLCVGIAL